MRYEQQVIERAKGARKRLFGSSPNVVRLAPLPIDPPEPEPEPAPEPESEPEETAPPDLDESLSLVASFKAEIARRDQEIADLCAELEGQENSSDPWRARKIIRAVAKAHGITFQEMISVRRQRNLCIARQHAMWELRQHTSLSLPQIGMLLGNRDHTTVLHGCRAHAARMARGKV